MKAVQVAGWAAIAAWVVFVYSPSFTPHLMGDAESFFQPSEFTLEAVSDAFLRPYWGSGSEYRPAALLLFQYLADFDLRFVKLACVLVHLLVAWMTWVVARVVIEGRMASTAAVLVAIHPLASEAVMSLVGLLDMLVTLAVLTVIWLAMKKRRGHRLLVFSLCFATPWLKESAVVLPAVAWFASWYGTFFKRIDWKMLGGALAGFVLYVLVREWTVPLRLGQPITQELMVQNPILMQGPLGRFATALAVLGKSVQLLVWPYPLSSTYYFNQFPIVTDGRDPRLWWGLFVFLGLCAWSMFAIKQRRWFDLFLLSCGAVIYAPTSHFVLTIYTILGERLLYPLLPFLALLVSRYLCLLPKKWLPVILASVIFLGGVVVLRRAPDWADKQAHLMAARKSAPQSVQTKVNWARFMLASGKPMRAIAGLEEAEQLAPWYAVPRILHARILASLDRADEAESVLLGVKPDNRTGLWHEALVEMRIRQDLHPQTRACTEFDPSSVDLAIYVLVDPTDPDRWAWIECMRDEDLIWIMSELAAQDVSR
ncbi:MAG: tetratricopeptide repeat protein [Acidobacteria bacterium]|nr:tetratricopeptide repeat protein [Acidobacteriota bacterium]